MASAYIKSKDRKEKYSRHSFIIPFNRTTISQKRSARDHFLYSSSVYGVWIREA